jgi:hypothetical protein
VSEHVPEVAVIERMDGRDRRVVGVYPFQADAEEARRFLEGQLSEDDRDAGVFHRITLFELGRTYP